MSLLSDAKPSFQKIVEHLQKGLASIRTGRSHPGLVEDLQVEVYGASQPLKQLASISTPDAKTVQIEPWDATVVKPIEAAIMKSSLGINPNVDGKTIRLVMPMMTDEDRQRMVKVVKEKVEEARIAIRQVREEVKKKIEKVDGASEDQKRDDLKDLDDEVKSYNEEVAGIGSKKEDEVTSI